MCTYNYNLLLQHHMEKSNTKIINAFNIAGLALLLLMASLASWYTWKGGDAKEDISLDDVDYLMQFSETEVCIKKYFDYDTFVCVCNATYCDSTAIPSKVPFGKVLSYTSDKGNYRFHRQVLEFQQKGEEQCVTEFAEIEITQKICLDSTRLRQQILGFGGSFTDSAGINFRSLSPSAQQKLMEAYFASKGLQYNLGRVPIGGTDFSPRAYSLDDDSPDDFQLLNFTLQEEDFRYKIPLINDAQKLSKQSLKLIASSWASPAWMKINPSKATVKSFGWLQGPVGGRYYEAYAKYHIRFLEEYNKKGITFWGMTPTNEPISCFVPFYPFNCLAFFPDMMRAFIIENLGPALRKSRFNATEMFIWDMSRIYMRQYVPLVMNDKNVDKYVDGIAVHWYYDGVIGPSILDDMHKQYPNKPILMTEACIIKWYSPTKKVMLGAWQNADSYSYYMIENFQHWVTGWIDWNLALDMEGGPSWADQVANAPIVVNSEQDEFYKQPVFYAIGHFSKFVLPGSHVIDLPLTFNKNHLSWIAFLRPDKAIVLIILNSGDDAILVRAVDLHVGHFQAIIKGNSLTTFIWWHT